MRIYKPHYIELVWCEYPSSYPSRFATIDTNVTRMNHCISFSTTLREEFTIFFATLGSQPGRCRRILSFVWLGSRLIQALSAFRKRQKRCPIGSMHSTYRDARWTVWLWLDTIIVSLLFVYNFEVYLVNNVSCRNIDVIKYSMVSGTENIRNPFQTFRPFTASTIYTLPLVLYTKSSWRISRAQVIRNTQARDLK
jgi:hypothetical protein